jgi:hypothetical protein
MQFRASGVKLDEFKGFYRLFKVGDVWVKIKVPTITLDFIKKLKADQRYTELLDEIVDNLTAINRDVTDETSLKRLNGLIEVTDDAGIAKNILEKTVNLPAEIRIQFFDELGKLTEESGDKAIAAIAKMVGQNESGIAKVFDEFADAADKAKWFEDLAGG